MVILSPLAMPKDLLVILDILEWLQNQIDSRQFGPLIPKTALLQKSQPRPFTSPWNSWRQIRVFPQLLGSQLVRTTQDTLNRDTVDADAVPGISTGIAYD
jgi:hypothetical protein